MLRTGTPWERRTLVRHVFSFSGRVLAQASFSSVFSVPSVRTLFLIFGTDKTRVSRRRKKKKRLRRDAPAQKRIAPSRREGALTPRCLRGLKIARSNQTLFLDSALQLDPHITSRMLSEQRYTLNRTVSSESF